jgi:transposase-like protein
VGFFSYPIVHWYRNIFSHVPSTKVREIANMLKAIHASEDVVAAREKAIRVIEKLCQCRFNFPHLCRSKIPQPAGYGDQPAG